MRYAIAASGLLGLAAAAPQLINIDAALAVPTPTVLGPNVEDTTPAASSYNPAMAASSAAAIVESEGIIEKRDACAAQPLGAGPIASPDTAASFLQDSRISNAALSASTPAGYKQSFVNKPGSSQQIGYLTYKTYDTYDVQGCADACNSEQHCRGFNIFFERDPSLEPGPNCPEPASTTNIKCSLYGYPVAGKAATNEGQWREQFQVVIAGSNGYSKLDKHLPSVNAFKAPTSLPATINAPLDNGYDTYNGMRLFNNNPYDPALCAAACQAQTEYDKAHPDSNGKYKPCNFFTSYILTQNEVPLGTYCALYTRSWDSNYATNTGYYAGDDKYEVVNAASYEITTPDSGIIPGQTSSSSTATTSSATTLATSTRTSTTTSSTPSATPTPVGPTPYVCSNGVSCMTNTSPFSASCPASNNQCQDGYQIMCGLRFDGYRPIGNSARNADECVAQCNANPSCIAARWSGQCALASSITRYIPWDGYTSFKKLC